MFLFNFCVDFFFYIFRAFTLFQYRCLKQNKENAVFQATHTCLGKLSQRCNSSSSYARHFSPCSPFLAAPDKANPKSESTTGR